jgi:hypothetical protein
MEHNAIVEEFTLTGNGLDIESIKLIGKMVARNTHLLKIDLSINDIGPE